MGASEAPVAFLNKFQRHNGEINGLFISEMLHFKRSEYKAVCIVY